MKVKAQVLPRLLNRTAIDAGCVIANPEHPLQRKYTSSDIEISENAGNLVITPGSTYHDLQRHDRGAGLSVLLARLVKTSLSADAQQDFSLSTKLVKTYELVDSDTIFESLCDEPAFQTWLEKTVKKSDAYFVVGMQTLADADINLGTAQKIDLEASVTVPEPTSGGSMNLNASGSVKDEKGRETAFTADGEQIYDIEVRKIKFGVFGAKEAENSQLSTKQVWLSTLRTRDSESDQPVQVQATLSDDEGGAGLIIVSEDDSGSVLASARTIEAILSAK